MDDKEYEAATAALYQVMGESSGITIECFGSSCRVKGRSGSWYQIDVLTKQSNGLQTVRTAIECKYWQRRVTRNVVSNLITTIEDTNIEKGVIVSKEGFTTGAIALAKQKNISLVEMREPNDADWEGKIKTIHINVEPAKLAAKCLNFEAHTSSSSRPSFESNYDINAPACAKHQPTSGNKCVMLPQQYFDYFNPRVNRNPWQLLKHILHFNQDKVVSIHLMISK